MYSRTLPSTLRGLGRLQGLSANSKAACIRQFSTTPSYGIRAIYSETDNAELNSILKEIQEKIILPAYLPPKQKAIVFDPSKRVYLEQNPIDIEVEGHEHRFKAIDKTKDVPKSRDMLWKALDAMETKEDWVNLGTVLAGLRRAGVMLSSSQHGKVIRLANQDGHVSIVIECLKQAQHTGLYITNKEQFSQVFLALNDKIAAANGDLAEIRQATRWGEVVLDLVQRPENMKKMGANRNARNLLHFSAVARGMLLHARVSLAQAKLQAEEPIDDDLVTIKDDLVLLRTLWAPHLHEGTPLVQIPELRELNPEYKTVAKQENGGLAEKATAGHGRKKNRNLGGSGYVKSLAWTVRGIRMAEGLASEEAAPLRPLGDALEKHLKDLLQVTEKPHGPWAENFEAIVGSKQAS